MFDSYLCIISLKFHHNHPLTSGHVTSFRPISNETKEVFFRLFHAGYNLSSAYHSYMEEIQLNYDNDEAILADRAISEEVEEFNSNRKRNALMQPYIASTNTDPRQPFVLVIQAGELVYIDSTADLDVLNTSMTILSTSTPIGSLPLAIILTSDETTNTFTKALDMLKCVMPILAFNGRGPVIGPKIFITDDCKAERTALHNIWNEAILLLYDCVALIEYLKKIVFAKTKTRLEDTHIMFISSQEWAIAYRQHLPVQNNHTNNFSEARIQVIKDAIFVVAHNKLDNFIAYRFQLLGWQIGSLDDIKIINHESMIYKHRSSKNPNDVLGEKCKELSFYANLHQAQIDKESVVKPTMLTYNTLIENANSTDIDSGDKSTNESSINESSNDSNDSENDENLNQLTVNEFRWFYNDIENLIKENNPTFNKSVHKFIKAYKKCRLIQDTHIRPAIASFFQTCDWKENRVNSNSHQHGSKRIKVQVASVARRKGTASKGQKKLQGKPRTSSQETTHDIKELNYYIMPARSRRQQTK
ncbi:10310_t:CDS:2 [Scutellospora calospora]|uniref:10310_t:CDS:1 n=1 Tax=Scutellospora calospora TaxID=85575 RepID=A0ACA9M803_9GLOM|nr:10310_t:CDS:2 [Scutellospora calospora]